MTTVICELSKSLQTEWTWLFQPRRRKQAVRALQHDVFIMMSSLQFERKREKEKSSCHIAQSYLKTFSTSSLFSLPPVFPPPVHESRHTHPVSFPFCGNPETQLNSPYSRLLVFLIESHSIRPIDSCVRISYRCFSFPLLYCPCHLIFMGLHSLRLQMLFPSLSHTASSFAYVI